MFARSPETDDHHHPRSQPRHHCRSSMGASLSAKRRTDFATPSAHLISAGKKKIVLNLSNVDYIDSSGVGELVSSYHCRPQCWRRTQTLRPHQESSGRPLHHQALHRLRHQRRRIHRRKILRLFLRQITLGCHPERSRRIPIERDGLAPTFLVSTRYPPPATISHTPALLHPRRPRDTYAPPRPETARPDVCPARASPTGSACQGFAQSHRILDRSS